jgi:hypothetical protein
MCLLCNQVEKLTPGEIGPEGLDLLVRTIAAMEALIPGASEKRLERNDA